MKTRADEVLDAEEAANDAAPASKPRPATGGATLVCMADVTPKPVRWIWPGYLPLGKIAIVDGDPGLGKSLATLDLAARVTTGAPMPGGARGELTGTPGGVVLLTAEDDPGDTLRPRLDAARADVSRVVLLAGVHDERGERMPNLGDLDQIRAAVASVAARLVIIDPIMAYLGGDAHRDNEVRQSLGPIAKLAAELGVSVVCVRHLNKSGGTSAIHRGGGSIAIIGAARIGMLVAADPEDDTKRVLAVSKSNLAQKPPALSYSVKSNGHDVPFVEWHGHSSHTADSLLEAAAEGNDDPTKTSEAGEWLRGELANGPRRSEDVKRAARAVGFSWRTVERAKGAIGAEPRRVNQGGARGAGVWVWRMPGDSRPVVGGPSDATAEADVTESDDATFKTANTFNTASGGLEGS